MSVKKFKIFDGNKKVGSLTCSEAVAKIMQEAFKQSDAPKVEIKEADGEKLKPTNGTN